MQQTKNERNLSLDFLKACAIFLVVFYHNSQLNPDSFIDNLSMLLPNAAVPCFFMASGAVFFNRPFRLPQHIVRIVRCYLVMVVWKALYLIFYLSGGAPLDGSLRKLCSYLFLFQTWEGVGTAHFWFMEALLTILLAAPLLYLCYHADSENCGPAGRIFPGHNRLLWYLLIVLLSFNQVPAAAGLLIQLLSMLLGKPALDVTTLAEINPFSFRYSNYFTYYLLGGLLLEQKDRITPKAAGSMAAAGITGLLLIKYIQTGSLRWEGILLQSGYYWISTMLLAAGLFVLALHQKIAKETLPGRIAGIAGSSTMGIFYLHIPLIFILTPRLFERISGWNSWLLNAAESLLICLIALFFSRIGRRIPVLKMLL